MSVGGGSLCPGPNIGLQGPVMLIPSEKGSKWPKKYPFFFCFGVGDTSPNTNCVVILMSSASVANFSNRPVVILGFLGMDQTLVTTPLGVVT